MLNWLFRQPQNTHYREVHVISSRRLALIAVCGARAQRDWLWAES
jgi:hypothetical protein